MIADFDLSDIKMLKILRRLKKLFGKKAFTAGIREALIERKKGLTKYFKEEETTFYDSSGEELKRRFVYTEELEMLLEFILQERDIEEGDVKWGWGKSFLQLCNLCDFSSILARNLKSHVLSFSGENL